MSIFGDILGKIFHPQAHAQPVGAGAPAAAAPRPAPTPAPAPAARPAVAPPAPAPAAAPVDVEAVLTQLAAARGRPSNWRDSIVDLLQLLDLDASLDARKQLADELNVHVAGHGSAEQNIALHKAVMRKLAENGGIVPDSLRN